MDNRTREEKEKSFADGEKSEIKIRDIINNVKNKTLKATLTKENPNWTPFNDLKFGDIEVNYEKYGTAFSENLDVKKNGWVTVRSSQFFGISGKNYYIIDNGSIENSYAIPAPVVKKLIETLKNTNWIRACPRSGDSSINLNSYDSYKPLRRKIPLKDFLIRYEE